MNNEMAYNGSINQSNSAESITSQGLKLLSSKRDRTDFGEYLDRAYNSKKAANKSNNANIIEEKPKAVSKPSVKKGGTVVKDTTHSDRSQEQDNGLENNINHDQTTETSLKTGNDENAALSVEARDENADDTKIKEIAEILGISQDKVMEILNALNLSVSDLKDHDVMISFMKELYAVNDISELLNIPNLKDMIVETREVLNQQDSLPTAILDADVATEDVIDSISGEIETELGSVDESENLQKEASVKSVSDLTTDKVNKEVKSEADIKADTNAGAVKNNLAVGAESETEILSEAVNSTESDALTQTSASSNKPGATMEDVVIIEQANSDSTSEIPVIARESGIQQNVSYLGSGKSDLQYQNEDSTASNGNEFDFNDAQTPGSIAIPTSSTILFRETQLRNMSTSNINTQDVVNQIVDKMKIEIKANVTEVKLLLRPESLGEVSLKISIENGIVTAQFIAENQRVKEIIESNFSQLKDTLQQQGVNISELNVSVGQDRAQERMDVYNRSKHKNASRIQQIIGKVASEAESKESESIASDMEERTVDLMA